MQNNYELDRYTTDAIDQNWFDQISIQLNDANSKSYKLIFKLKNSQVINTTNNQTITKYCPYRYQTINLFENLILMFKITNCKSI